MPSEGASTTGYFRPGDDGDDLFSVSQSRSPQPIRRPTSERPSVYPTSAVDSDTLEERNRAELHPSSAFVALQEWEGHVVEVDKDNAVFTAQITDMTNRKTSETEEAEFPISDLTDSDLELLQPGAIFRWSIGYQRDHGTKRRISQIVFRRLPQWRASDLAAAALQAETLAGKIDWE